MKRGILLLKLEFATKQTNRLLVEYDITYSNSIDTPKINSGFDWLHERKILKRK